MRAVRYAGGPAPVRAEPTAHLLAEPLHLAVVRHLVCLPVGPADLEALQQGSSRAAAASLSVACEPASSGASGGCGHKQCSGSGAQPPPSSRHSPSRSAQTAALGTLGSPGPARFWPCVAARRGRPPAPRETPDPLPTTWAGRARAKSWRQDGRAGTKPVSQSGLLGALVLHLDR